jgi:hypothetical protein
LPFDAWRDMGCTAYASVESQPAAVAAIPLDPALRIELAHIHGKAFPAANLGKNPSSMPTLYGSNAWFPRAYLGDLSVSVRRGVGFSQLT